MNEQQGRLGGRLHRLIKAGESYTVNDEEDIELEPVEPADEPDEEPFEPWETDKLPRHKWRRSGGD